MVSGLLLGTTVHVIACALLLLAVYLIVVHWTIWLQGSSLAPLLCGAIAFFAAWPAVGWKLALLAFVLDPGCVIYAVFVAIAFSRERRSM